MFSIGKMNRFLPSFLASFLFFISHSQTASNTSSQHRCLPDQSSALLQLRLEFVEKRIFSDDYFGVSYPKMNSWKADTDCCSWDGVVCNAENGHVIDLDLSNSWLNGPLKSNSSLFRLHQLQKLNLAFNNFSSSIIPSEFGQLVRLTHLNLSSSSLTGQIPSEISRLSNLVSLDLTYDDLFDGDDKTLYLKRIDFEALVQNMTNLRELQLESVIISSSVPQSLVNLSSLTSLSLSECNLHGKFPTNIFLMPKLQTIDLSNNDLLIGFLPEFHSGSSLELLDLSYTNFSGKLPNSIANLESLITLSLHDTMLSGEIPNAIGNLKSLNYLDLDFVNWSGAFPLSIWNLTRLSHLSFERGNFHGQLPSTLGNLANLIDLTLGSNLFHGEIPSSIGNLTQLENLDLSENSFHGRIPVSLTNLTQLIDISLSQNQLIGPIPFELGRITELTSITLGSNSLTGTILSSLFTVTSLTSLDLSRNQLTGPLKFQNISSSQLEFLDLSDNKIEGKVPKWFWNVGKETLRSLDISFNRLSGFEQPPTILPWKKLEYLDLRSNMFQGLLPIPPLSTTYFFASNNNLTGRIPSTICMLNALQILDLSNNKLIGQIPHCLGNFSSSLSVLNMRNNCFQGELPGTFTRNLETLDLSLNQIKGKIPRSLVNCTMLELLNLGNNKLNDIFPFWLESLPELQILILRANGFHGSIQSPHTNFGFSKLHVIDLSHNNFSGMLPSKYFNAWNAMQLAPEKSNPKPEYMGDRSGYYEDSITVTNKGMEMELVKILTIFIAIDFSNNRFYGEIPNTMGNLKELIVLNLSSNSFNGPIPSSFGDLTQLQSLDLSQNKFLGKIPQQLVSLTFLAYLNLSHNQLKGPIPQGRQFATFENSSFEGNLGLCGFPLSKKCGNIVIPTFEPRQESSFGEGFNWKVVVVGYASGLVIGLVLGHVIISRRPDWFTRTFGVNLHK